MGRISRNRSHLAEKYIIAWWVRSPGTVPTNHSAGYAWQKKKKKPVRSGQVGSTVTAVNRSFSRSCQAGEKSQPDGYSHQEQHQLTNQQVTPGLQTHHSVIGRICRNRLFSRSTWLKKEFKSIPRLISRSKTDHSMMGRITKNSINGPISRSCLACKHTTAWQVGSSVTVTQTDQQVTPGWKNKS